jgi:Fe-S cluster assembly protein SufD
VSRPTNADLPLLGNFAEVRQKLSAQGPEWLRRLRRQGLAAFEGLGWPTPDLEAWTGTRIGALAEVDFHPAEPATPDPSRLPELARIDLGGPRLLFVDGRYVAELSRPVEDRGGLFVGSLAEALDRAPACLEPLLDPEQGAERSALYRLNDAFLDDGALVWIPPDQALPLPVQLVFVSTGTERATASHPRTVICCGRGSRAAVVQIHVGLDQGTYLSNAVTRAIVAEHAELRHDQIQAEAAAAFHVAGTEYRQARDSRLASCSIDVGGRLVRHDLAAALEGRDAECRLDGLYATGGEQRVDNHTVLDHAQPRSTSREVYKGVLTGNSRAVFHGKIVVRQDAQGTNAKQSNPNLLLSRGALAQTRPQLEISADDVKCTHGATIGRLDEEAVFYLRSRGLERTAARRLLVHAFAGEILDRVPAQALREGLWRAVARRLEAADV